MSKTIKSIRDELMKIPMGCEATLVKSASTITVTNNFHIIEILTSPRCRNSLHYIKTSAAQQDKEKAEFLFAQDLRPQPAALLHSFYASSTPRIPIPKNRLLRAL